MAINVVFTVTIVVLVPMQGFTFFMISASRGHLSVAEELLMATAGADVDAVNKQMGFFWTAHKTSNLDMSKQSGLKLAHRGRWSSNPLTV